VAVNTLLGVPPVTALVAVGTEVGAGAGVLLVLKHAASKPNANRAIVNRTNVFIINPFHQRRL